MAAAVLLATLLLLAAPSAAWAKPQPGSSDGGGPTAAKDSKLQAFNKTGDAPDEMEPQSSVEGEIKQQLLDGYDKARCSAGPRAAPVTAQTARQHGMHATCMGAVCGSCARGGLCVATHGLHRRCMALRRGVSRRRAAAPSGLTRR